jgi:hypothetical protein
MNAKPQSFSLDCIRVYKLDADTKTDFLEDQRPVIVINYCASDSRYQNKNAQDFLEGEPLVKAIDKFHNKLTNYFHPLNDPERFCAVVSVVVYQTTLEY